MSLRPGSTFRGSRAICASLAALAAVGFADVASAQVRKLGPEFVVNTYIPGGQLYPAVEALQSGEFVIVWSGGNRDASPSFASWVQRFSRTGERLGAEIHASANVAFDGRSELQPAVSAHPDGGFVVAWSSYYSADYENTNFGAQRFNGLGEPVGEVVEVVEPTADYTYSPSVGVDGVGAFVVGWSGGPGARFRVFDTGGYPVTEEFPASTSNPGSGGTPAVLGLPGGGFILAWNGFGRRIAAAGFPIGEDFQMTSFLTPYPRKPDLALLPDDGFVAVWESLGGPGRQSEVIGRRFDIDGTARGTEFQANRYTTDVQELPRVSADADGSFVVVWRSAGQDGDGLGIFGQAFDANGSPLGPEFQASDRTAGDQGGRTSIREVDVAMHSNGEFIVTWTTPNDGFNRGIAAQRFSVDAALGPLCGDVERSDLRVTSSDALGVLHAGVGNRSCELCVCDADSSGAVTSTDALLALRHAVQLVPALDCPVCAE